MYDNDIIVLDLSEVCVDIVRRNMRCVTCVRIRKRVIVTNSQLTWMVPQQLSLQTTVKGHMCSE